MRVGQKTWKDFNLPSRLPVTPGPPPALLPRQATKQGRIAQWTAALRDDSMEPVRFTREDSVKDVVYNRIRTPDSIDDVMITQSFIHHLAEDETKAGREQYANFVLPTLRDPAEVWVTATESHLGEIMYRRRFMARYEQDDKNYLMIVQEGRDGSLSWTFYPAQEQYLNKQRSGHLLYHRGDSKI